MLRAYFAAMIVVGLLTSAGIQASAEPLSAGNTGDVISAQLPLQSHDEASLLANDVANPALALAMDNVLKVAEESPVYFDLLELSGIELVSSCGPVDKPCKPTCTTERDCSRSCKTDRRGVRTCTEICWSVTRCTR